MKRWKQTPNTYSEMNVCDDGDWVRYTDAEAEKIAYGHSSFENGRKQGYSEARKQGYEEGRLDSRCVEYSLDVARKQGVQEERDRIFRYLSAAEKESYSRETIFELRAIAESLYDGTRGASEPRCTCGGWELRGDIGHLDYCPCYKRPEKEECCDCGRHEDGDGNQIHYEPCPYASKPPDGILHNPCMCLECRKTPEVKPLEKLNIPNPSPNLSLAETSINALVDRVNRLTEGK